MQKPIKKIKNGTFSFNAPKYTAPYSERGWVLKSYTITFINRVSKFTELVFSNGEVITGSWPVPASNMSVERDLEMRGKDFHFGDFPNCFKSHQLKNEELERGSDLWNERDPEMEKYPHIKETIMSFTESTLEEDIYELYRDVSRGRINMPSSWEEYHQMQLKQKAKYDRSMGSAPSKKDEM